MQRVAKTGGDSAGSSNPDYRTVPAAFSLFHCERSPLALCSHIALALANLPPVLAALSAAPLNPSARVRLRRWCSVAKRRQPVARRIDRADQRPAAHVDLEAAVGSLSICQFCSFNVSAALKQAAAHRLCEGTVHWAQPS